MVVVGADDSRSTGIPLGIVPHDSEASDAVNIEVAEVEAAGFALLFFTIRLLVAQRQRQAAAEQPVAGKDPVVGIAHGGADIAILDTLEVEAGVELDLLTEVLLGQCLHTFVVEVDMVVQITQSCHPCATADFLTRALGKGCRIGEVPVVEDIVEVDTCDADLQTIEGDTLQIPGINVGAHGDAANLIVVHRAAEKQIGTKTGTVDAGVQLELG